VRLEGNSPLSSSAEAEDPRLSSVRREEVTMSETFARYDAADYLGTEEDIAAYVEASAEEGDPTALLAALGAVARARNMSRLSRDAGMTREGLYKALSSSGNPSFATVARIAKALGFRLALQPMKGR
jgi:probable addiction module antidote protein